MRGQFTSPPICSYITKDKNMETALRGFHESKPNGNMDALVHTQSKKTTFTAYT